MKRIFLMILLALSCQLNAQDADKTVSIVVSGSGKTQDEAKQNALRSAIEQAFGTFISSKTEILNDNLVKDEIVSVSAGNIKSFKLISEAKTSDDNYSVIVNATISVSKLTTFAESKGITIEFNGELLALNVQQQIVNEKNELLSIKNIAETCKSILLTSYDFRLSNGKPIQNKSDLSKWEVPIVVDVSFNSNILNFKKYLSQSIVGLSMSADEVSQYSELGKKTYKIIFGDSSVGGSTSDIDYLKAITKNNPNIIFKVVNYSDTLITTRKIKTAIEIFKGLPESSNGEIIFFDESVNPILHFRNESTVSEIVKIVNYSRNAAMNFKVENGIGSYSPKLDYPRNSGMNAEYTFGDFSLMNDSMNFIFGTVDRRGSFPLNFCTISKYGAGIVGPNLALINRNSFTEYYPSIYGYQCERYRQEDPYSKVPNIELKTLYNTKFGFVQFVDCNYSQIPRLEVKNKFTKVPYYAVISMFDFKPSGRTILKLKFVDKLSLDDLNVVKKYSISKI